MRRFFTAVLAVTAVGVVASPVAEAKSVDVAGTATCTAGVKAKIKAGPRDPGQIKTNVQIDDVAANTWTIVLTEGLQTRRAVIATSGVSNSIDRDFFTTNNAGADTASFVATRPGARCTGTVKV